MRRTAIRKTKPAPPLLEPLHIRHHDLMSIERHVRSAFRTFDARVPSIDYYQVGPRAPMNAPPPALRM